MLPLLFASAVALASSQPRSVLIAQAIERRPGGELRLEGQELRISGVATSSSNMYFRDVQKLYVQDQSAGIALFARRPLADIAEGDRVEAAGRLTTYNGEPELLLDEVRVLGHMRPPAPIDVRPEELLSRRYAGRLVRTETTVISTSALARGINIELRAGRGVLIAHFSADQARVLPKNLVSGTTVRITGVSSEYTRGQTSWQILPRAATDVVLIERAPVVSARAIWMAMAALAVIGVIAVAWIFSLRRRVQRALAEYRELDERYRFLFEDNPMPMWVCDARSKRILTINHAAVEKYGFTAEEFRAMSFTDLGDARGPIVEHRTKSGGTVFVELLSRPIVYARYDALIFLAVDVTEWVTQSNLRAAPL